MDSQKADQRSQMALIEVEGRKTERLYYCRVWMWLRRSFSAVGRRWRLPQRDYPGARCDSRCWHSNLLVTLICSAARTDSQIRKSSTMPKFVFACTKR